MKKLLLVFGLTLCAFNSYEQVIFKIDAPAGIAGNYDFTYTSGWGANLINPTTSVTDTIKIAQDSLACSPVSNVSGKIALVYRGTCEFGAKALAAQNAGAVAVIIVNNIPGAPIAMGAGASGGPVTIPVIMITQADGAILNQQIHAGQSVVGFIGNKLFYYADDLGFQRTDVLRANGNAIPSALASTAADFSIDLGAWAYNYGTNDQTNITVNTKIMQGATSVYDQTSAPFDLESGDSVFVDMPVFSLPTYTPGDYTLNYSITNASPEEFPNDNIVPTTFNINDTVFALSRIDAVGLPVSTGGVRPVAVTQSFSVCLAFRNENASRLGVEGMYFSAAAAVDETLDGREVSGSVFEWNDVFTDLNAEPTFDDLDEITSGSYYYESDDQNVTKYMELDDPVYLQDNQRYLFCVRTFEQNDVIFFGYDTRTSYETNLDNDLQPLFPIESTSGTETWFAGGFEGGNVPALGVKVFDATTQGLDETVIEAYSYPNPAKDVLTVKVTAAGNAQLLVTDMTGRQVMAKTVKLDGGAFTTNVAEMKAGAYLFNLSFENGATSQFKVVVAD